MAQRHGQVLLAGSATCLEVLADFFEPRPELRGYNGVQRLLWRSANTSPGYKELQDQSTMVRIQRAMVATYLSIQVGALR